MITDWRDFPGAPPPGSVLIHVGNLDPGRALHSLRIADFPVLLLASGVGFRAFVNACPHQFLPLDHRSASILSADGEVLRCSNHSAGFSAHDGQGIDGHGQGVCLAPVPLRLRADGALVIDDACGDGEDNDSNSGGGMDQAG